MKKTCKKLGAVILALTVCAGVPASITASANSAQHHWSGSYSSGMIVKDENCPVVVENEVLTLDVAEFPSNYYDTMEEFMEYGAKVTAQYTFYNPADYDVEMTLAFPFGRLPDYTPYDVTGIDDTAKYMITSDGAEAERTLRHTYYDYSFSWQRDLARIYDGYREHSFYSPDMPVYKYEFGVTGITYGGDYAVHAEVGFSEDAQRRIVSDNSGYESTFGNSFYLSYFVDNLDVITIYSVGEPLDPELDWRFYYYNRYNIKQSVSGEIYKVVVSESTFKDFALSFYGSEYGVSQQDWYNAVVECMDLRMYNKSYVSYYTLDVSRCLLRWYEYSLSIPAHGRVVNEVTAPLYPGIDGERSPLVYSYEYLLSPAQSWASFGTLEIRINTPYYLVAGNNWFNAEKTDYGYRYVCDGLPDSELNFELCSSENPKYTNSGCGLGVIGVVYVLCILAVLIVAGAVIAGITIIVVYAVKHSKAKDDNNKQ